MSKALVIIKSGGMGDLTILIANIHAISMFVKGPVTVLAQKNTKANEILMHDPNVKEVIELEKSGIFNIIKKIKYKKFTQSYIYSDSIRLYLISKFSGIEKSFHYKFFSKKNKNFYKVAKEFTEKLTRNKIDCQSKIFWDSKDVDQTIKKFKILNNIKNIVWAPSASGITKRWDVENYIKLFEKINENFPCKFFLAVGPKDIEIENKVLNSSLKNNCTSFSKMGIAETIPIISACQYYIGNDTGWGQIAAALNLKSLFLFCDSPPSAYGVWRKNISIVVPEGETLESCGHNTRGKDKILFDVVLKKSLELLS